MLKQRVRVYPEPPLFCPSGVALISQAQSEKQTILKSYFEKDQKQLGWLGECEGIFSETARKRICSPSSRRFVSSAEEDF